MKHEPPKRSKSNKGLLSPDRDDIVSPVANYGEIMANI